MRGPGCKTRDQRLHSQPELTGNFGQLQSKEILHLRAGDQHGNAIGESDHHGTRNKLHGGPHPGCAENDKQHAGHDCAHEQTINAVRSDYARNHYDESAGRTADLRR